MKKNTFIIALTLMLLYSQFMVSQNTDFEEDMMHLAAQTVAQVKQKNKLVVAVWFFHNTKGKKTEVGDYVGRDFSVHFTNIAENFEVVDRDHIEQLSAEHKWNEEGFIDPATAKEVNKLIAADAIVTGTVDYTLHHLRVRIKIIDTETGKQIAAAIKTVRPDESLKFILSEEYNNRKVNIEKDERVIVVEDENDPRTTNEDCERQKTGDYCFQNNTEYNYKIMISNIGSTIYFKRTLTINRGQNACIFNVPAKGYSFLAVVHGEITTRPSTSGMIKVEKCKSLTYTIGDEKSINTNKKRPKPQPQKKRKPAEEILDIFVDIIKKRKN